MQNTLDTPSVAAKFLSVEEAAAQLNISRGTIFPRIKDGSLASVKFGGRRLIPASEIVRLIEQATKELSTRK